MDETLYAKAKGKRLQLDDHEQNSLPNLKP